MTMAALVLTMVKAAAVFALLGVTVRTLKRIDHRRAGSDGGPGRRGRRNPRLRLGPSGTHRRTSTAMVTPGTGAGTSTLAGRAGLAGSARNKRVKGLAGIHAPASSAASVRARLRRPRSARRAPRALEIVERATLGRTSAVVLLRVRDQHLLLGVTDQQINVLRTLEPGPAIDLRRDEPFGHSGSKVGSNIGSNIGENIGENAPNGLDRDTGGDVRGDTGSDVGSDVGPTVGAGAWQDTRGWSRHPRPHRAGRDHIELLDPRQLWQPDPDRPLDRTDATEDRS